MSKILMFGRMFDSWGAACLVLILLHENCVGGWKLWWTRCLHAEFDVKFGPVAVLRSKRDFCALHWDRVLNDARCPRSIVENVAPLLLAQTSIYGAVYPMVMSHRGILGQPHRGIIGNNRARHPHIKGPWAQGPWAQINGPWAQGPWAQGPWVMGPNK